MELIHLESIVPEGKVSKESFDYLMNSGHRRSRNVYSRIRSEIYESEEVTVLPLRIVIDKFFLSKSQKKTINKNKDLKHSFKRLRLTPEIDELFEKHKTRLKDKERIPEELGIFVGEFQNPAFTLQCEVRDKNKLVALSFLDIGSVTTSGVYAMFDLDYSHRRLGIYTMLLEILFTKEKGRKYYHPGLVYSKPSYYDYKRTFHGMEYLDWNKRQWLELPRLTTL